MGINRQHYKLTQSDLAEFNGYWWAMGFGLATLQEDVGTHAHGARIWSKPVLRIHQKRHDCFLITTFDSVELRQCYSIEDLNHSLVKYVTQHRLTGKVAK